MRALSVSQPWASLLVLGIKCLETRSWQTVHRGPLLIHASRNFNRAGRALCVQEPICTALRGVGIDSWRQLPLGAVLGVVELRACVRVEDAGPVPPEELPLGDFTPGRWLWQVAQPQRLTAPVPYRGKLGLFEIPNDLLSLPLEVAP
jgi:hypothetical protein